MTIFLPSDAQPLIDQRTGRMHPTWRRWLISVTDAANADTGGGIVPTPCQPTEPVSFVVSGSGSVRAEGSVAGGEFIVGLVGDRDAPLRNSVYGVSLTGRKGWQPLYDGVAAGVGIATTDSGYVIVDVVATPGDLPLTGNAGEAVRVTDSVPGIYAWDGAAFTIDPAATGAVGIALAPLADAGTGTALKKIVRDAYGRVSATETANIDDLADVDAASPSNGNVLTWDAGTSKWKPQVASGAGGMTLIGSFAVTGAAATSLSVTGLDLATDGIYYLEWALENATGTTANISLTLNADTTTTNYWAQFISGNGGVTGTRQNSAIVTSMLGSECVSSRARMVRDRKGYANAIIDSIRGPASSVVMQSFGLYWTSNANVTGFTISSSVANSLAIGSTVKVFKLG